MDTYLYVSIDRYVSSVNRRLSSSAVAHWRPTGAEERFIRLSNLRVDRQDMTDGYLRTTDCTQDVLYKGRLAMIADKIRHNINWPQAVAEVILIIAGILGALAIDSW